MGNKLFSEDTMTPRERMLAALRLEETDRISIGLRGIDPYIEDERHWLFGFYKDPSYQHLKDLARKNLDIWHLWHPRQDRYGRLSASKRVEPRVDRYVEGEYEIVRRVIETPKGVLSTISNRRVNQTEKSWRNIKPLIETDEDLETFLSIPYEPVKVDITSFYKEKERLGEAGVLMTGIQEPISSVSGLFKFEDFVKRVMLDRDTIVMLMDIMFERSLDYAVQLLEAGAQDIFQLSGAEFVGPPMFNPRYFEDFVVKYDRKIIKLVHEYDGIVYHHCHGSVNAVLEMFADMGVDVLHPIEPPPMGDTPLKEAKRRIGDKVCLLGNIQISDILYESRETVDRNVRQAIYEGGPDGFILCTSASPSWVPLPDRALENYIQLTETALEYGKLPRRTLEE